MNTKNTPVFVIGVARAGTTLAARILSSSPFCSAALIDSQESIFKAHRSNIAESIEHNIAYDEPLYDAYFSSDRRKLSEHIQNSDLKVSDISKYFFTYAKDVSQRSYKYSPLTVEPDFYKDVQTVYDAINKVIETNATSKQPFVAFKDNYVIEFARPLKKAFPEAKFIFPFRDPRAIVASRIVGGKKNNAGSNIHFLSRMRAWRTHLAWAFAFMAEFPEDALMLPYEQVVASPETWGKKICDFLGIPFEDCMLGNTGFASSSQDKAWTNNSSFEDRGPGIFTRSVDAWRKSLSDDFIKSIEYLCWHEMRLLGYSCEKIHSLPVPTQDVYEFLDNDRHVGSSVWRCDTQSFEEEIENEQKRHALLAAGNASLQEIENDVLTLAMAEQLGVQQVEK